MTTKQLLNHLEISKTTLYDWLKKEKGIREFLEALYIVSKYNLQERDINCLKVILEDKFIVPENKDRDIAFEEFLKKKSENTEKIEKRKRYGKRYIDFLKRKKYNKLEQALTLYSLNLSSKQRESLIALISKDY